MATQSRRASEPGDLLSFDQMLEQDEAADVDTVTFLTFRIGAQVFAVDVRFVREILASGELSQLPNAPHDVMGMIDLRGQAIAIVDLAGKLGARADGAEDDRIVVFEFSIDDRTTSLGVIADEVLRVDEVPEDAIEPVPETLSGWQCDEARGMIRTEDSIAILLRIDHILCHGVRQAARPFEYAN
ncbi:chemotaxis protein CheW [Chachezhania antarctica]|uniref:chemotaxis protein CheW n=1 Tax=Chachezhania antarctica TaxID=2340860 RepID=UPI000EB5600F|nr:chemotaxis protein CheW [Chachezhania antarctica]|tara:strand:+ start:4215 stop:4769 length:555 start_codon:yes stop_codon:yes gene_type:complete